MKVGKIVIRTIFLSAALIGLAGAVSQVSLRRHPVHLRHQRRGLDRRGGGLAGQAEHGGHCGGLPADYRAPVRLSDASTTYPSIDANFANLLQGVILFIVLAADFFTRFQLVRTRKEGAK